MASNGIKIMGGLEDQLQAMSEQTYKDIDNSIKSNGELMDTLSLNGGILLAPTGQIKMGKVVMDIDIKELQTLVKGSDKTHKHVHKHFISKTLQQSQITDIIDAEDMLNVALSSNGGFRKFGVNAAWSASVMLQSSFQRTTAQNDFTQVFEPRGRVLLEDKMYKISEDLIMELKSCTEINHFSKFLRKYGSHIATDFTLGGKYIYNTELNINGEKGHKRKETVYNDIIKNAHDASVSVSGAFVNGASL
eukprot:Pgem_evm1s13021